MWWLVFLICVAAGSAVDGLLDAVSAGKLQAVQREVRRGAPVNVKAFGSTPLILAIRNKRAKVALFLIDQKARLDLCDSQKRTPLHWASYLGLASTVQLLLKRRARTDALDNQLLTPLHLAASAGHIAVVHLLLPSFCQWHMQSGFTPLHSAVLHLQHDVVDALLDAGADIDAPFYQGAPLHFAVGSTAPEGKRAAMVERLLKRGASVKVRNDVGKTPLMDSIRMGSFRIARLLLKYKADLNAQGYGGSAVHVAAVENDFRALNFLITHKAALDAPSSVGFRPLQLAVLRGHTEFAAALIANGVKTSDSKELAENNGILHLAVRFDRKETLTMLLKECKFTSAGAKSAFGLASRLGRHHLALEFLREPLEDKCSICLEDALVKRDVMIVACGHYFHGACVSEWIADHSTCPLCRRPLS